MEEQNELEKERAWIRNRNGKIYDMKIQNMANTTSNGGDFLKQEINNSESRLLQAKYGISVNEIVQKPSPMYFVAELEPYFRGTEKILRNIEKKQVYGMYMTRNESNQSLTRQ